MQRFLSAWSVVSCWHLKKCLRVDQNGGSPKQWGLDCREDTLKLRTPAAEEFQQSVPLSVVKHYHVMTLSLPAVSISICCALLASVCPVASSNNDHCLLSYTSLHNVSASSPVSSKKLYASLFLMLVVSWTYSRQAMWEVSVTDFDVWSLAQFPCFIPNTDAS